MAMPTSSRTPIFGSKIIPEIVFLLILITSASCARRGTLGVNWGTMTSHRLPSDIILKMLRSSNISKVKLFDCDPSVIRAFEDSGVELMIGLPNDMLATIATSPQAALDWVRANVSRHIPSVNIRYVAVGNEPFLKAYNSTYEPVTIPALVAIQDALNELDLDVPIKAVVPLNADVLSNGGSILPSAGTFRPDIQQLMQTLVAFLHKQGSPFVVNIYPFLSLQQDVHFPEEFAFFDGSSSTPILDPPHIYTNVFEASFDLLVTALRKNGYGRMPIIVGEVGWPTDGDIHATPASAHRFNQGLVRHVFSGRGTPLRPGALEVYVFALVDEDEKSVLPGNFERHWGMYAYDARPKYELDILGKTLSNYSGDVAHLPSKWCVLNPDGDRSKLQSNVAYACSHSDCTALDFGGSCNNIGLEGNASYAFNSYYQMTNQQTQSCVFQGLGMVTTTDPSEGSCHFPIDIQPLELSSRASSSRQGISVLLLTILNLVTVILCSCCSRF